MGTDIWSFAEVRDDQGVWWRMGESLFPDPRYTPGVWEETHAPEPIIGRNYQLFAFLADVRNGYEFASLADVRNGYGFAGVLTGTPIVPISEPRGIPADTSSDELSGVEFYAQTFLTVGDLDSANWDTPVRREGVVERDEYESIRDTGFARTPQRWAGGATRRAVTTEQADRGESPGSPVKYYWESTMARECSWFVEKVMPVLRTLGAPQDVRVVMAFD